MNIIIFITDKSAIRRYFYGKYSVHADPDRNNKQNRLSDRRNFTSKVSPSSGTAPQSPMPPGKNSFRTFGPVFGPGRDQRIRRIHLLKNYFLSPRRESSEIYLIDSNAVGMAAVRPYSFKIVFQKLNFWISCMILRYYPLIHC